MARHAITKQLLRCRDGRHGWATWELVIVPLVDGTKLYGMRVQCDLGDHWLAPTPNGPMESRQLRWLWPSLGDAEAARDRWEQQEAGAHPEETTETGA